MSLQSYKAFASDKAVTSLCPLSDVDAVVQAAMLADSLSHWFDRQRAVNNIAQRVEVEPDLIFRLMRKGVTK